MSEINPTQQQIEDIVSYIEKHYKRFSYALIADPSLPITPISSKIGGLPYWDFAQEYPCDDRGEPLCFIGQINLQEIANTHLDSALQELKLKDHADRLPNTGLLQFFALKNDTFGCTFEPNSKLNKVVYIEDITKDQNLTMEQMRLRIAEQGLDEALISNIHNETNYWPIEGEIALRFKAVATIPNNGDFDLREQTLTEAINAVLGLNLKQDPDDKYDVLDIFEELFEDNELLLNTRELSEQEADQTIGWLLGYPNFTQDNPIPHDESLKRFDTLLLCLDGCSSVGDNFNMMWGDCGIANFFINSKRLEQKNFSDIFYTWDCC